MYIILNNLILYEGEFFHNFFKIETFSSALFFVAILMLSLVLSLHLMDRYHLNHHFDLLYHIKHKTRYYRLTRKYERKYFTNTFLMARLSKIIYKTIWRSLTAFLFFFAIKSYIDNPKNSLALPMLINTIGLTFWLWQVKYFFSYLS